MKETMTQVGFSKVEVNQPTADEASQWGLREDKGVQVAGLILLYFTAYK